MLDIDLENRRAEFGIIIGKPDARGRGYGTETEPYARALTPVQRRALFLPLAYRFWNDERQVVTPTDLLAVVRQDASIPEDSRRTKDVDRKERGRAGSTPTA